MNLSPNFTTEEAVFSSTAARLGINNALPDSLLGFAKIQAEGMEVVRRALGNLPIHVDSWYRCLQLNIADHGATDSAHTWALATDFLCRAFGTPLQICQYIVNINKKAMDQGLPAPIQFDKLIMEGTWVHISFDPKKRGIVLTAHFTPGKPTAYTNGLPTIQGIA